MDATSRGFVRQRADDRCEYDPRSGMIVALFHARRQAWTDHFAEHGAVIVGLTAVGRVTVDLLQMNAHERIELRAARRLAISDDE